MLEAAAITKSFVFGDHKVDVLRGVSLRLGKGERLAITGKSGAGKSTLLHILGGLSSPTTGTLQVLGADLYAKGEPERAVVRSRDLGIVFQAYHLLPDLTLFENVMIPSMNTAKYRSDARAVERRALELIEKVGLQNRCSHRPGELSGGEQQRVALARAMMNNPRVILADEPTGNLDDSTGGQMLELLFGFAADESRGLVVVTHSRALAERCDRWLAIEDGVLVEKK